MSPAIKVLVGLLVQLGLLAFAVYVVVADAALPGASMLTRAGLATTAVAVGVVYGETTRLRAHMGALLAALQSGLGATVPRDDKQAIDVLVSALGSQDAAVREKAHRNLVRLTGQDLPPDAARWAAWWREARPTFRAPAARP